MSGVSELWNALRGVNSLRFDARSEAATGWDGVGVGAVVVSEPADSVILFHESGTWTADGRPGVPFTNVFRWSARDDALRLEHLRFGPERPVFLFDLAPDPAGVWRTVEPHRCGDDLYAASLTIDHDFLWLIWSIDGPRKRETIRYRYAASPPSITPSS